MHSHETVFTSLEIIILYSKADLYIVGSPRNLIPARILYWLLDFDDTNGTLWSSEGRKYITKARRVLIFSEGNLAL